MLDYKKDEPKCADAKRAQPSDKRDKKGSSQSLLSLTYRLIERTEVRIRLVATATSPAVIRQGLKSQTEVCGIEDDEE